MSDDAVKAKTGRAWPEWFSLLDRAGARKMKHQEIVKYLQVEHDVGPWWAQMVTVTYEQVRGLRDKHQKPEGYQISVSRTVRVPLGKLYDSFANDSARKRWLGEKAIVVRGETVNKSMRITWSDRKTSLEVGFYPKGEDKSQVVVQHGKLPDAGSADRMKVFWSKALDRLRESFEGTA